MSRLKDIFSNLSSGTNLSDGVVGIDIGSSSIKVVELKDRNGVVTLSTYGELQLGPYAEKQIGESVTLTPKQEQESLVDVIRESAVTARNGVFAMPLSSSFVTNVTVDTAPNEDLSAKVRIEARKVIPASLSEVTLDWAEVGSNQNNDSSSDEIQQRNILIAAIQNNALERFKLLMQFAGLRQPPTEIECFSTIRALFNTQETNIAIIDIGANSTKLYIAQNGLLMRMHRIRAGGAIATEQIAKEFDISFEEAELLKQTVKRNDTKFTKIKQIHDHSYDRAFREFNQVLREQESKNNLELSTIYVSGGGALFTGVDVLLKNTLNREIVIANPFSKVAYPAFMQDTIRQIGPSFTAALGAAIRTFE